VTEEKYEYLSSDSKDYYEFESIGPKGTITKAVQFTLIDDVNHIYNLGLGDIDPSSGEIVDNVISDNKDTNKILFTVGEISRQFLVSKPYASILIEGNSESRNRLYRMGINKNLTEMKKEHSIFGLKEQNREWERFNNNSNYSAFIISKRK
jgi:hypothetical protein